ncbi:acyltransferase family protein [Rhodococcoides fascians]|uniref:acyltransferase family protein n=1 Tax=Rhodococcoides fascians TaxID=1828 RepID=UPI003CE81DD5
MTSAVPDRVPTGQRLKYLDGIRALAAMYVFVHHAFMTAYPVRLTGEIEGWVGRVLGWALWGHFGVTVFIVLAGYSLTLGLANLDGELPGGLIGFVKRRTLRIAPPYWAALGLAVVLTTTYIGKPSGTHWDQSLPTGPKDWAVNAVLLQDLFPITNTAYPFWSVAVEYHIYLLLPIILLVWRWSNWGVAVGAGAVFGIVGILAGQLIDDRIDRLYPEYYLLFSLAVAACVAKNRITEAVSRVPWLVISLCLAGSVVALISTHSYVWVTERNNWLDLVVGLAAISLILALETGRAPRSARVLSWKPLAGIAVFSYSLYLVHAPLLQVFWQLAVRPLSFSREGQLAMLWLVGVPVILGISYGFYRLFEKPFVPKPRLRPSVRDARTTSTQEPTPTVQRPFPLNPGRPG